MEATEKNSFLCLVGFKKFFITNWWRLEKLLFCNVAVSSYEGHIGKEIILFRTKESKGNFAAYQRLFSSYKCDAANNHGEDIKIIPQVSDLTSFTTCFISCNITCLARNLNSMNISKIPQKMIASNWKCTFMIKYTIYLKYDTKKIFWWQNNDGINLYELNI